MDTCYRNCTKRVFGLISASLLFMSLFFVQSYSNLGHAAEPNLSPIANSQMQLAWWHGPRYPNAYYGRYRSEEHTSELQSQSNLVCRLLLEKKDIIASIKTHKQILSITALPGFCRPKN